MIDKLFFEESVLDYLLIAPAIVFFFMASAIVFLATSVILFAPVWVLLLLMGVPKYVIYRLVIVGAVFIWFLLVHKRSEASFNSYIRKRQIKEGKEKEVKEK